MSVVRNYKLFGLNIHSELELPELAPSDPKEEADLTVSIGPSFEIPGGPELAHVDGKAVLTIEAVARYTVCEGSSIHVEPARGAPERDVRLYLLGSAMGLVIHQRGLLPLHANAIELGGKTLAFVGSSGAGKSTLASWFHDRGLRVIADDVCVVHFDASGKPFVAPGLQRLRLWRDALEKAGRDPSAYSLSFSAVGSREKYDVPLPTGAGGVSATPLCGVYLLERGDKLRINELAGVDAAEVLFANTYRGRFLEAEGSRIGHWQACVQLARTVPIYRAERRWGLGEFDAQSARLLEHAERLSA